MIGDHSMARARGVGDALDGEHDAQRTAAAIESADPSSRRQTMATHSPIELVARHRQRVDSRALLFGDDPAGIVDDGDGEEVERQHDATITAAASGLRPSADLRPAALQRRRFARPCVSARMPSRDQVGGDRRNGRMAEAGGRGDLGARRLAGAAHGRNHHRAVARRRSSWRIPTVMSCVSSLRRRCRS